MRPGDPPPREITAPTSPFEVTLVNAFISAGRDRKRLDRTYSGYRALRLTQWEYDVIELRYGEAVAKLETGR